jgi:hypothetical protein
MATRSEALRHGAAERNPSRRAPARQVHVRPPLGVVDRRTALERARRRQARVLFLVSGLVLAGALTVAAAGHALLAATQIRSDTLQGQLAGAIATQQSLQLRRAELETPTRVLALAEHRFKMVSPSGVTYLQPVSPGESVQQAESKASTPKSAPATHRTHGR